MKRRALSARLFKEGLAARICRTSRTLNIHVPAVIPLSFRLGKVNRGEVFLCLVILNVVKNPIALSSVQI